MTETDMNFMSLLALFSHTDLWFIYFSAGCLSCQCNITYCML